MEFWALSDVQGEVREESGELFFFFDSVVGVQIVVIVVDDTNIRKCLLYSFAIVLVCKHKIDS